MNSAEIPPVVIVQRRSPRSKHSIASEIYTLTSSLVIVGLMCYGVYLGITTGKSGASKVQTHKTGVVKQWTQPARSRAPRGVGKEQMPIRQVAHATPSTIGRHKETASSGDRRGGAGVARADALVLESVQAARHGMLKKANDLATQARRICPTHPAATGAWYLAAYASQYPGLSDNALMRLNGAHDDIDLGPTYGRVAFIERNGDAYTFRCRGGNKTFTTAELNAMDGVRFRITRQFLDNGNMPANDLILAAVHHLKNIDESGKPCGHNRVRSLSAAQARCRKAAGRNGEVSQHARHVLALFGWLEARGDSEPGGHESVVTAPAPRSNAVAVR